MNSKNILFWGFGIFNLSINGFILLINFFLSGKIRDYYFTWNIPYSWLIDIPVLLLGLLYLSGIVLFVWKKALYANLLIAAPLILSMPLSLVSDSVFKTSEMKLLDERNRTQMKCIAKFQQEHPNQDSTGVCPF